MASRYFVDDISDYEEEEDQHNEEEAEVEDDNKPTKSKVSRFFDDSWRTSEKRTVRSEKEKRWGELDQCLNSILDEIYGGNYKKAFEHFKNLVKLHAKAQKAIQENGYPNFFIRNMADLISQIKEHIKESKDLPRFNKEVETFSAPFADKLKEYAENPDAFPIEEAEDDVEDMNDDEFGNDSDDDESSEDSGPGKWFQSSSDENLLEEEEENEHKQKKERRERTERDYAGLAEERILLREQENLDDDQIKEEIQKDINSRLKGKIITDTDRLKHLLDVVVSEEIVRDIQMEICFTIMQGPSDSPISLNDWKLALENCKELIDEAETLTTLFERLNKDFWARSVDPKHLFTSDTAKLHSYLPQFLKLLEIFADKLEEKGRLSHCVRLQIMILEHRYHELIEKPDDDTTQSAMNGQRARSPRELTRSILMKVPEEGMFDEMTTLNIRVRAMLYYAISLAFNGHPIEAQKCVVCLPEIPEQLVLTRILYNRALAEVGKAAFLNGLYALAYDSLRGFVRWSAPRMLGQHPKLYAPWLTIEPAEIEIYMYLSAMLLDLPYLTTMNADASALPIRPQLHKDFMTRKPLVCPETILDKVVASIERLKRGEWQNALDILKDEIEQYIPNPEGFIKDIKYMSLCSFLLTANLYYDSIKIPTLCEQFGFATIGDDGSHVCMQDSVTHQSCSDVRFVVERMRAGRAPVTDRPLTFDASVEDDFVSFFVAEKESPLADYGRTLQTKCNQLLDRMLPLD